MDLKNTKFDIEDMSRGERSALQAHLIALGYNWLGNNSKLRPYCKYLYIDSEGQLTHCVDKAYYQRDDRTPVKVTTTYSFELNKDREHEIERIENEMRKLADQLAELKEGGK